MCVYASRCRRGVRWRPSTRGARCRRPRSCMCLISAAPIPPPALSAPTSEVELSTNLRLRTSVQSSKTLPASPIVRPRSQKRATRRHSAVAKAKTPNRGTPPPIQSCKKSISGPGVYGPKCSLPLLVFTNPQTKEAEEDFTETAIRFKYRKRDLHDRRGSIFPVQVARRRAAQIARYFQYKEMKDLI